MKRPNHTGGIIEIMAAPPPKMGVQELKPSASGTPTQQKKRSFTLLLVFVATVLGSACLPGDRGKTLWVANNCDKEVWIRVRESSTATAEDILTTQGEQIAPHERSRFSVFDNDLDGLALSVSPIQSQAGKLTVVSHSEEPSRVFKIEGAICP